MLTLALALCVRQEIQVRHADPPFTLRVPAGYEAAPTDGAEAKCGEGHTEEGHCGAEDAAAPTEEAGGEEAPAEGDEAGGEAS